MTELDLLPLERARSQSEFVTELADLVGDRQCSELLARDDASRESILEEIRRGIKEEENRAAHQSHD